MELQWLGWGQSPAFPRSAIVNPDGQQSFREQVASAVRYHEFGRILQYVRFRDTVRRDR